MSNNTNAIKTELQNQIDGLRYISESEHPFELIELGEIWGEKKALNNKLEEVTGLSPIAFEYHFPDTFFENTIKDMDKADKEMMTLSDRYQSLYDFLRSNFDEIQVIKSGDGSADVLIVLLTKDKDCFVLRTQLIEA